MKCCEGLGVTCRLFLVFLSIAGVVFSVLAMLSCEFFEFDNGSAQWFQDPGNIADGTVGMFQGDILVDAGCKAYPDDVDLDNYMLVAQYGSILSIGFGTLGLLLLLADLLICNLCGTATKYLINFVFFCAYSCQAMTFALFGTEKFCNEGDRTCSLGLGGIYSIVAFSMYMITSCAICCTPQHKPLCCQQNKTASSEKQENDDPYGSSNWSEPSVTVRSSASGTPSWSDPLASPSTQNEEDPLAHWARDA